MQRLIPVRTCAFLAAILIFPHCLFAQNTWTSANAGIEGGVILSFHPTPGGSMLASTERGLHRFEPSSASWTPVVRLHGSRWHVAADRAGTLFATTHLRQFSTAYTSTDDGRTWNPLLDRGDVVSLVGDGSDVELYGRRGRSTDGGTTWTPMDADDFDYLVPAGEGRFAAMSFDRWVLTSDDGGRTWSTTLPFPHFAIAAFEAIGDNVLVVSSDTLYVATGGEAPWSHPLEIPVRSIARIGDGGLIVSSHGGDRRRATDGIHRSDDSGRTWRQIASGYFRDLAATSDEAIFAASSPGISRSTDGGATWQPINAGLEERIVATWAEPDGTLYGLAQLMNTPITVLEPVQDFFRSSDNAASWQLALDSVRQIWTFFGGRGIATTHATTDADDQTLARTSAVVSVDHGRTWTTLSAGATLEVASTGESIGAVSVLDGRGRPHLHVTTDGGATWSARATAMRHDRMAITESGMIVVETQKERRRLGGSTDFGVTWRTLLEDKYVQEVIAPGGETIVAVTYDASDTTYVIERSSDGGATFTSTKTRDMFHAEMRQVNGMTLISMVDRFSPTVWRSSDSGATWASAPTGYLWVGGGRPTFAPTGELFAVRSEGMIRSTDYGATWHVIDTARSLGTPTSNGRVLVTSNPYGGVYRTSQLSDVKRDEASPTTNTLVIRPIPTTDRVVVEARGAGTLTVVDMSGRQVRRMTVDGSTDSAVLDISGLAAGVYGVRLVSATGTSTAQLVVVGQ